MRRGVALVLAVAVLAAAWPATAQPQSLGVTPGRIGIADAQPAQTYLRSVSLQNQLDSDSTMTVETQGAAAAWVSTQPASGFTVPARTNRDVVLSIAVPADAGPGRYDAVVTFTTEPKADPQGSGQSLRPSVGVTLNFTVGGVARELLAWSDPRAEDAAANGPVTARLHARNDGNVATDARAAGEVLPFQGTDVLARADGTLRLDPGEEGDVVLTFPAGLPVGQYRVRLSSMQAVAFEGFAEFKVVAAGTAPDGVLRGVNHEPLGIAGQPVRLDAWFENTGSLTVSQAKWTGEVRQDGRLLAPVASDALTVAPGQHVNLTFYWTPPEPGTYRIHGTVLYDGYLTLPAESILNVVAPPAAASGLPWVWILLAMLLVVVGLVLYLVLRRKDKRPPSAASRKMARH